MPSQRKAGFGMQRRGSPGPIGSAGATVVAGLAKALSDPSPRVRDLAAIAPEAIGGKAIASIQGRGWIGSTQCGICPRGTSALQLKRLSRRISKPSKHAEWMLPQEQQS